ncbi:MAG TPA: ATP-binding protein, partial [Longimicrobium sp.]|nr:ATP-binding protein [Longimicrobium sp.]
MQSPGEVRRGSLRGELLFNLAFLCGAALLLAVWTLTVVRVAAPSSGVLVWILLAVDVLAFVFLGNHLIQRHVERPISEAVGAAEAIAGGDRARRVPAGDTREMAALAGAINRMTDQLLENQERLSHNVHSLDETNRLLLATQRDLVQAEKLASIGRLSAGVAHEIGNPLGAVLGYTSLLRKRGAEAELVDGLEREARRIDRIVRALLDYSRPAPAHREPVEVNESIGRALELLRVQGRLGEVEVDAQLAPGPTTVRAEPFLLDQVFLNLMDNACRAMEGRGKLTLRTFVEEYRLDRPIPSRRLDDPPGVTYAHLRRPRVTTVRDATRIEPGTQVVRFTVADTGVGIPVENIEAIFDPFFTTRAPGEGTGLGLAIVA